MSDYLREQADGHKVWHDYSGRSHFFKVQGSTKERNVVMKMSCTCKYFTLHGPKGKLCSHILAVLDEISKKNGEMQ